MSSRSTRIGIGLCRFGKSAKASGFPNGSLDFNPRKLDAIEGKFTVEWKDVDKVQQVIAEEIPAKVSADTAYQNAMKNSDKQNARIEHDAALQRVLIELLADHTELFKQYSDNPSFKKWLQEMIFAATYEPSAP